MTTTEKEPLDSRIIKIAEKLQKLRKDKKFNSYEDFALAHGLSRVQYWRMEKGTNFRFTTFLRVLDAHGMSPEDFFKGIK
jgi:hypothetical protein